MCADQVLKPVMNGGERAVHQASGYDGGFTSLKRRSEHRSSALTLGQGWSEDRSAERRSDRVLHFCHDVGSCHVAGGFTCDQRARLARE